MIDQSVEVSAYDPELVAAVSASRVALPPPLEPDGIADCRRQSAAYPAVEQLLRARAIHWQQASVPGRDLPVSVFLPAVPTVGARPVVFFIHGGGMVAGDRHSCIGQVLEWVERYGIIAVSIEYRLAPEYPDPFPVEDCYAGLEWTVSHVDDFTADSTRLVVMGVSAGGGIAAGVVLMSRDRLGPVIAGQILDFPMLDDRNNYPSMHRFANAIVWPRSSNETAWSALLGARRGTDAVSPYAAPARAREFGGLPPTFIDVGSAEILRDEAMAYGNALAEAGCSVECHVWAGGFHNFGRYAPESRLANAARAARTSWITRTLGLEEREP